MVNFSHSPARDTNILDLRFQFRRVQKSQNCKIAILLSWSDQSQILQKMSNIVKQLIPLLDRVLIKRAEAVTKTAGGIVIPEKAQSKVLHGEVVAVGPGARKDNGEFIPILVKVGDKVLLPEYGGTKVSLENDEKEYHLFRESDILAKIDN